jgi:hypothetical protein
MTLNIMVDGGRTAPWDRSHDLLPPGWRVPSVAFQPVSGVGSIRLWPATAGTADRHRCTTV